MTLDTVAIARRFAAAPLRAGPEVDAATRDRHVAVARRFVEEGLGRGDPAAFDELVDPEVWVSTLLKPDGPIHGREEYKRVYAETIGAALTDATLAIEEILATTDGAVVVRFSAQATHSGKVGPVAATGSRITLNEVHLMRFRGGRIAQNHVSDLNPQHWGMLMAPIVTPAILG